MLAKLQLNLCSESRGVNKALDFQNLFAHVHTRLRAAFEGDVPSNNQPIKPPTMEEVRKASDLVQSKIKESFLSPDKVPARPNTAGLAADFEKGEVDFGWAISKINNTPANFTFESLFCNGQKVYYHDVETDEFAEGIITEVIFTLNGQVRYSIKTDEGRHLNNVWGGWLSKHTTDHYDEIISTLGNQNLDDGKLMVKRKLGRTEEDALHFVKHVVSVMAEFASERNVNFSMTPLECVALFIYLIDKYVNHYILMEKEDTGCDNQVKHLL